MNILRLLGFIKLIANDGALRGHICCVCLETALHGLIIIQYIDGLIASLNKLCSPPEHCQVGPATVRIELMLMLIIGCLRETV